MKIENLLPMGTALDTLLPLLVSADTIRVAVKAKRLIEAETEVVLVQLENARTLLEGSGIEQEKLDGMGNASRVFYLQQQAAKETDAEKAQRISMLANLFDEIMHELARPVSLDLPTIPLSAIASLKGVSGAVVHSLGSLVDLEG